MEGDGMLWGEGREAPPFHISAVLGSDVRCKVAGGKCQRLVRGGRWQESGDRWQYRWHTQAYTGSRAYRGL